jgi:hypothetical protein
MNIINNKLKVMRSSQPAKVFYTGCSVAGFYNGFRQSTYDNNMRKRLITDRLAWATLYSGIYTYAHPIVAFHIVKCTELTLRNSLYDRTTNINDFNTFYTDLLELPHGYY